MKKIKVLLMFVAALGIFSCEDATTIIQPGEVNNPDEVYADVPSLQRGLNSVYGTISTENTINFTSIFTDETAIGINNGGQGINDGMYVFQLNAGSGTPQGIWQSNYTLINFTNRVIDAGLKLEPTLVDENDIAEFNLIMGQLYAIRAFAHFQLETWFSTDLTDDNALGVMILDFVPSDDYDQFLPRSTNGEVFAFIESDLDTALDYGLPVGEFYRVSPNFVRALRARMAIYRENYEDALTYANQLLAPYPLASTVAAYQGLWDDSNSQEIIFKLARVDGEFEIASLWHSQSSSINGSPFFEVGRSLFNLFEPGDIRRTQIIDPTSRVADNYATVPDYVGEDVLVINKYPGNPAQFNQLLNDIKVFRVAEMYLIKAEALAGLGNLNGANNSAASVLRQLRTARFENVTQPLQNFNTPQEAWAAIMEERRVELAFEGHRYIDIKRLGVKAGGLGIDRYSRDCEDYNACTLPPTDHRFTMPIPTVEIIANPNIGAQNPGY